MSAAVTINPNILEMEYAVRGPIPQRAAELKKQGREVVLCNIGNPQAFGQPPISYYREILGLLEFPEQLAREQKLIRSLLENPKAHPGWTRDDFPSEYLLAECEEILSRLPNGLGAYTESKGPLFIREAVARFIDHRDRNPVLSDPEAIFLTNGASEAVRHIIDMLISKRTDGIMVPIPQYPLYSATIRRAGGVQVNYYPDEEKGWLLDRSILEEAYDRAKRDGVTVKAVVVINPGNPTGAVIPHKSLKEVVEFAHDRGVAILADEVYQENTYGAEFVSLAKVVGKQTLPLFSLHSTSKGFCGECGRRGGYVEVRNPPRVEGSEVGFLEVLLKQASVSLCSNTAGQILTYLMVTPPKEGSVPHKTFVRERDAVLADLFAKAEMIRGAFAKMDGVECFGKTGALYLFPRLNRLPKGTTDFDYCMSLLETTGLCTVNGSGFGQRPGTSHLRIAFLPPRGMLEQVLPAWIKFHNKYVSSR
jgi:aspartate/methionine/tyrosine aminotransferase